MIDPCYICDAPASERDHFPRSRSLGGTETFPICTSCHDAKDRVALRDWDPCQFYEALGELWGKASAAERLVLAKLVHIANQGVATIRKLELTTGAKQRDALDAAAGATPRPRNRK